MLIFPMNGNLDKLKGLVATIAAALLDTVQLARVLFAG